MNATTKTVVLAIAMLGIGGAVGWAVSHRTDGASHASAAQPLNAASGSVSAAATPAPAAERKVLYWYDPMVPGQKFDKPGKSPFMDMQLVPRYADEADAGATDKGPALAVSTAAQQALGVRLATVEQRALGRTLEAVGTVQLNERDIAIVQARTAGFVERVYARAPGDVIAAGAPLVDVLNPEWLAAQQEWLAIKATGDAALTQAARARLVLLGMPAALIERAERSGQAVAVQTITAPSGGVISELMVRAGMTVAPGMTLARINGLGTVWLEAAVPEMQAAQVRVGQPVEARFPALAGELVKGQVAAVLSEANRETRTLRLRIELPNPGQRLKAGLFAQVALRGAPQTVLVLPAEAVIRTGRRALVYVAEAGGRFRPVEVEVGEQVDEQIVIRSGLAAGQQVVASGQFLIDSEASLQGVLARAAVPAAAASSATPAAMPAAMPASAPSGAAPTETTYHAQGKVVEIAADEVTLDHETVPALKWPGMTMPFKLAEPTLAKGLKAGQAVAFDFAKRGDEYVLTRITQRGAAGGKPQGASK